MSATATIAETFAARREQREQHYRSLVIAKAKGSDLDPNIVVDAIEQRGSTELDWIRHVALVRSRLQNRYILDHGDGRDSEAAKDALIRSADPALAEQIRAIESGIPKLQNDRSNVNRQLPLKPRRSPAYLESAARYTGEMEQYEKESAERMALIQEIDDQINAAYDRIAALHAKQLEWNFFVLS